MGVDSGNDERDNSQEITERLTVGDCKVNA